jgi:hypothetical protein
MEEKKLMEIRNGKWINKERNVFKKVKAITKLFR